ncbi:hypothetical protein GCM10027403_19560 [Arthrobacter tecti]
MDNFGFAVTLIGGALGGAFVAGIFAVIGAWLANRREHRNWLRNERLNAYRSYLAETRPWFVESWFSVDHELSKEAQAAILQFQIIATPDVLRAAERLSLCITALRSRFIEARKKNINFESIYKEAGVSDTLKEIDALVENLGKAMRKSMKLPAREVDYWVPMLSGDGAEALELRGNSKG